MVSNWKAAMERACAALRRRGRDRHEAEDLVQEAWVKLARYQQEQPVDQPEAFLMKVALNLSIDAHRRQLTRGDEVLEEEVVVVDTAPGVEATVLARERVARLAHCMARLPPATREIFLAHRLEGLTYQQIARRRGLSISSIERHVAKATLLLATWMNGW